MADFDDEDCEFERTLGVPLYEIFAPLYKNETGKVIAVAEFYENANDWVDEAATVRNSWLIVGGIIAGHVRRAVLDRLSWQRQD